MVNDLFECDTENPSCFDSDYKYPVNLFRDVFGTIDEEFCMPETVPRDWEASIEYVIHMLPERQCRILEYRYKYNKSLLDIGNRLGLTKERIRQIERKAIITLKSSKYKRIMVMGVEGAQKFEVECKSRAVENKAYERGYAAAVRDIKLVKSDEKFRDTAKERLTKAGMNIQMNVIDDKVSDEIRVIDAGFSNRTRNALLRTGLFTLSQVYECKRLDMIPGIGTLALREILKKLDESGYLISDLCKKYKIYV